MSAEGGVATSQEEAGSPSAEPAETAQRPGEEGQNNNGKEGADKQIKADKKQDEQDQDPEDEMEGYVKFAENGDALFKVHHVSPPPPPRTTTTTHHHSFHHQCTNRQLDAMTKFPTLFHQLFDPVEAGKVKQVQDAIEEALPNKDATMVKGLKIGGRTYTHDTNELWEAVEGEGAKGIFHILALLYCRSVWATVVWVGMGVDEWGHVWVQQVIAHYTSVASSLFSLFPYSLNGKLTFAAIVYHKNNAELVDLQKHPLRIHQSQRMRGGRRADASHINTALASLLVALKTAAVEGGHESIKGLRSAIAKASKEKLVKLQNEVNQLKSKVCLAQTRACTYIMLWWCDASRGTLTPATQEPFFSFCSSPWPRKP